MRVSWLNLDLVQEMLPFDEFCKKKLRKKNRQIVFKVEKILKGSLDLISSPSPSVKIQNMGGKSLLEV